MHSEQALAEALVAMGLIERDQLADVREAQATTSKALGDQLVEMGLVTEQTLLKRMSAHFKVPYVDLGRVKQIRPSLLRLVPRDLAEDRNVLPLLLRVFDGSEHLVVALSDPTDTEVVEMLGARCGYPIKPALATHAHIAAAIQKHYAASDAPPPVAAKQTPSVPARRVHEPGSDTGAPRQIAKAPAPSAAPSASRKKVLFGLQNQGLGSWLARRTRMAPDKDAVIYEEKRWSNAELEIRATRMAHGLHGLGIRRGDRVAYLGLNCPTFLETFFGTALLGAIFVPLNPGFTEQQLSFAVHDAGCRALVYGKKMAERVRSLLASVSVNHVIAVDDPIDDALSYESFLTAQPTAHLDVEVAFDDLCMVAYTSGTTGPPKGVMLTHGNLTWNVMNFLSCCDYLTDDVVLAAAPLYRLGGFGINVLPPLFKGGTVLVTTASDPAETLKLIENHRVSVLFGNPNYFQAILRSPAIEHTDLSSVRFCISGGNVVPEWMIRECLDRGMQFQQGFGLTEAGPMALLLPKEDVLTKIGALGRPPFFCDVRVVDDEMNDVGPGESGELIVRGPNVTPGYWNNSTVTNDRLTRGGWLRTGDAVRIDEEEHIYFAGRTKDVIRFGGRAVYPVEIENVLITHPDVAEAAIVEMYDERGEVSGLAAFVVPREHASPTPEALMRDWSTQLPHDRQPAYVEVVTALPKNANHKVLRADLREELRVRQMS